VVAHRLPLGGADGIGRLADVGGDGADRLARADDDHRQDQQAEGQASGQNALAEVELVHEQTERQQAVDDGRHARQVGDVDLDQVGDPIARRVLLEVDAGRDPERHAGQGRDQHHQDGADPGRKDAGLGRMPRRERGEELPGEAPRAVDQQVDEQRNQRDHADHHRQQADEGEDLVAALVLADECADRFDLGVGHVGHQYTSRKRLRSRWPSTLNSSVMSNSTRPTAKMLWYSRLPCGRSPRLTCTM